MEQSRGVLGLYVDEPIGMDHPVFVFRAEARMRADFHANEGSALDETLSRVRAELTALFGECPQPLVDAAVSVAWFEAKGRKENGHD